LVRAAPVPAHRRRRVPALRYPGARPLRRPRRLLGAQAATRPDRRADPAGRPARRPGGGRMSAEVEAESNGNRRAVAVAGRFYPADPDELRGTVDDLLAEVWPVDDALSRAYVVPHAGLRYSGAVAAEVYARLVAYQPSVTTVLLLGPAHFVPLRGC